MISAKTTYDANEAAVLDLPRDAVDGGLGAKPARETFDREHCPVPSRNELSSLRDSLVMGSGGALEPRPFTHVRLGDRRFAPIAGVENASSNVHPAALSMPRKGPDMDIELSELDRMQAAYKAAVEEWIAAIRREEALASVNHSVAEVDRWEAAHFREDELRSKVKAAKKSYEDALRQKFFDF